MAKLAAALMAILTVAYPLAVYIGLTRFSTRGVGLLLVFLLTTLALLRMRGQRREHLVVILRMPLAMIALAGLAALLDDARFMLAMPVLVNAVFFIGFAGSLRSGVTMVERFARMQEPDLSEEKVAYCRRVTVVWAIFVALNGLVIAGLAVLAPVSLWALYTGLLAYLLIGCLFTVEYIVRKYRFRDYGSLPHDRLIARVFPPRENDGAA